MSLIYARPHADTGRSLFVPALRRSSSHCTPPFHPDRFTPSNNVCYEPRGRKGDLPAIPEGSIVRPPIVSGISRERARPATMGNDWLTGVRVMRILAARKRGSRVPRIFKSRGFAGRIRGTVLPFIIVTLRAHDHPELILSE